MTFLSTVIIVHFLILLYFFSEQWIVIRVYSNHTFIISSKKNPATTISSSPQRTFSLFLAKRSFLSVSQPFWKLGQTSDTTAAREASDSEGSSEAEVAPVARGTAHLTGPPK